ncbi:MAG TPA: hypothetical protein VF158_10395 [Longimicrobiales bacterium]
MSARRQASHYLLTVRCDAPLHHGAFDAGDTGNAVLFRRMPLAPDPTVTVPAFSGNALRGALRRVVMRDLLDRCDLALGVLPPIAWDRLYAALANGGHLDSAETRVDPEAMRALRDAVPALSVLGAALYSYLLPGRVSIGWLWPVCRETVDSGLVEWPEEAAEVVALAGAEELVTEVSLVRHVDRDQQDPARSGVTPMPVTVEALIPGTVLMGSVVAMRLLTPVELGVIGWGLDQLTTLGAKGAAGFGRVTIRHEIPAAPYEAWREDAAAIARAREALCGIVGEAVPAGLAGAAA